MVRLSLQFFAHKKGVGSTKNGRDSESKRLGVKRADGQAVLAGANCASSLSDNDIAGNDCLTVSLLYAKALGLTVTAVLRRTDTLLMSKEL